MNLVKRFESIQLWKKFAFLGLFSCALILAPILMYRYEVNKTPAIATQQQRGLSHIRLMLNIIQRTQQHRDLSARFLQDNSSTKSAQRGKAEELEAVIFSYEIYVDKNPNPEHRKMFKEMVDYWHGVHKKVSNNEIDYRESFEAHTLLINMQLQYVQSLIEFYRFRLDPDENGYLSLEACLIQLPKLVETLAQIGSYSRSLLTKGNATNEERIQLRVLMLYSAATEKEIDFKLQAAGLLNQKNHLGVYQSYQPIKFHHKKIIELAQSEVLVKEKFSYETEEFYSVVMSALDNYYSYMYFFINRFDNIFLDRAEVAKRNFHIILFYMGFSAFAIAFLWVVFIHRLLKKLGGEPHYISEVLQAISRGDLDSDIETHHRESVLANVKHMQEALKESDRLKNEYIATLSHELKTPLTAISSALSLSVNGQLGALPEPAMSYLAVAQKNSVLIEGLISDLLDTDKLSVGKLDLDMHIQPLMPIIDDVKVSMTPYVQKYNVRIISGPRFEYLLVKVDARRLRQVLKNLLSNAAKFSKKGDEIAINTLIHFDKVRIEIIDHGCGIADEFKDKLFEKYSQAAGPDSSSIGSIGLGLGISKQLVQAMGGELGFTSSLGVGSCFFVDLPLEELNSD